MQLNDFKLERFFAAHEFNVPYVLSASDPESLTLRELLALADGETQALWGNLGLGYTESQGHPLLRAEIARLYRQIGPENVLVAAPEEGIFLAMHALLRPGDHVIATAPAYQSLHEVARGLGCAVMPWRLAVRDGDWRLDLDVLRRAVTGRTRLLVVNFPHNPTGYLPAAAEQAAVLDIARAHGLYLFSDEMYWGLEYEPPARLSAACDLYEKAVSLHGLSKSLALPGLRIGWLATQDRGLLSSCARHKDYTTICSSAPSEILAIIALRARGHILTRNMTILRANLARAGTFFAGHADLFQWLPPRAGSVAFPALVERWPVEDFCRELRVQQGVLLAPAGLFDHPGNHFRLGLGRQNFGEALARVEDFLPGRQATAPA